MVLAAALSLVLVFYFYRTTTIKPAAGSTGQEVSQFMQCNSLLMAILVPMQKITLWLRVVLIERAAIIWSRTKTIHKISSCNKKNMSTCLLLVLTGNGPWFKPMALLR